MADSAISIFNININFVYEWSDWANKDRQIEVSHIKHCFCSLQFRLILNWNGEKMLTLYKPGPAARANKPLQI